MEDPGPMGVDRGGWPDMGPIGLAIVIQANSIDRHFRGARQRETRESSRFPGFMI